jgi:hypothetical protein
MRLVVASLIAVCGCFSKPEPSFGPTDAPGVDARVCSSFGPWSSPALVAGLNDPMLDEETPALSPDGTMIVFARLPSGGGSDLYMATFDGTSASNVRPIAVAATAGYEESPAWRPDGTQLYFLLGGEVFVSDFDAALDPPFGPVRPMVAPPAEFHRPRFRADHLEVFDFHDHASTGNSEIVHSVRGGPGAAWPAHTPIAPIADGPSTNTTPTVSGDGLTLYFSTDRFSAGSYQLYQTTRASLTAPFSGSLVPVAGIGESIRHPDISRDQTLLVFARYEPSSDILVSQRSCNP